ncbi:type IV secretion system protein VirB11 [Pseudomonas sp. NFPP33]|nr:P-type DNA transfer ATPase VirB11 [Pseudomonas sp. NFPP33]AGH89253.1 VirB11-like conjugak transfer protein [uncultured bacterium]SDA85404.1 type IV secretion system protein VirB11 [Pseudomonas sp. NFPP33]
MNAAVKPARALEHHLSPLAPFMADDSLTEIVINRPNEVWTEGRDGWVKHNVDMPYSHCQSLATLIASYNGDSISEKKPVLSASLPAGERVQVVIPGACTPNTVSMTIRKPSVLDYSLDELEAQGSFAGVEIATTALAPFEHQLLQLKQEGRIKEFLELAVKSHRNIIIAGATGSGKTTVTKSLIRCIDPRERVITIEDVHELFLREFPNKVHLFYKNFKESVFTSKDAIASCVRMKPDRILLAELRGPETLDYIDSLNTGHPGSITTIHANSAMDVFTRLVSLVKKSDEGLTLDPDYIRSMCVQVVDVVLYYERRKLKEIYYEPERKYAHMG